MGQLARTLSGAAITLFMLAPGALADATYRNPDQSPAAASMATFGPTTIPQGWFDYCRRLPERCELAPEPDAARLDDTTWRTILAVNDRVNREVRPITDNELFGVSERWDYPRGAGDCEDFALLKRRLLHEAGLPLGSLLLTVAHDRKGGGHAVLTVRTDAGDFVLDNVEKRVLPWREANLHFLKRQAADDPRRWVDLSADRGREKDRALASLR